MKNVLHAGVARVDISPPLGAHLKGYPRPDRVALSLRDSLNATTLVLEYDGLRVAIVTVDLVMTDDQTVADIRQSVHEKTAILRENITICSSHTHSGPVTRSKWGWGDRDEKYIASLIPKATDSVVLAMQILQRVKIGIGTTESDVGVNRRKILENNTIGFGVNPWGIYDPLMTVLRIESENATLASLIHYGAHATVFNDRTSAISRDWPGVMIDRVEQFTKAPALFIVGALGDVGPRCNTLGAVGDGEAALQEVGSRAAMDAMRAWRSIKELRDMDMATLTKPIALPYRALPSQEETLRAIAKSEAKKNEPGLGQLEYMHWSAVLAALKATPQTHKTFEQTITRIGPVAIVPVPGEAFCEIVLRLRHASPLQHTLCASVTNGANAYFVTRESLHRGGYEVNDTKANGAYVFAENIDDVLVGENLNLLREMTK